MTGFQDLLDGEGGVDLLGVGLWVEEIPDNYIGDDSKGGGFLAFGGVIVGVIRLPR